MLAKDTRIGTDANGRSVPVQRLGAGDKIYDLLTNSMHEVIEIKSRSAVFDRHQTEFPDSILQPVKLRKGSLDGVRPLADLVTSPAQEIFVDRTPDGPRAELSLEAAYEQMACGKAELLDIAALRYYAVFTKADCAMLANGVLVRSYCPSRMGQ